MKKNLLLLTLILLIGSELVSAQSYYNNRRSRRLTLSFGIGTSHYLGDLADNGEYFSQTNYNLMVGARFNYNDRFAFNSDLIYFSLRGNDSYSNNKTPRNLSFRSNNVEWNFTYQISLFPEHQKFYLRKTINPYICAGIGVVWFQPRAQVDGKWYNLRKYKTEGVSYGPLALAVPLGIGAKIRMNPFFNIIVDGAYRWVNTDYLDDVSSGIYPDQSSFDEIGKKLSDPSYELNGGKHVYADSKSNVRGNPGENDGYFLLNVKFEYYFRDLNILKSRRMYFPRKSRGYRAPKGNRRTW